MQSNCISKEKDNGYKYELEKNVKMFVSILVHSWNNVKVLHYCNPIQLANSRKRSHSKLRLILKNKNEKIDHPGKNIFISNFISS